MKILQLPIKIFLILSWLMLATEPVRSQSGNMSDITMPSPDAMVTEPPTEEVPVGDSEPAAETPTEEVTASDGESVAEDIAETVIENVTPPAGEAIVEDVTRPAGKPIAEDVTTPAGETVTEDVTTPAGETVTEDVTTPAGEPVVEDVTRPAGKPIAEDVTTPAGETVTEDVTTPAGETVTEDVTTPAGEPVVEDVTTPAGETVTEDVTTPAGETVTEDVTTPAGEPVVEDVTTPAGETVTEDVTTPAGETVTEDVTTPAGETVTEDVTTPAGEPVAEDVTTPAGEPVAEDVTTPAGETVTEDVTTPAGEPVAEDVTTPAGETVTEDVTTPAGEPVVEDVTTPAGETVTEDVTTPAGETVTEDVTLDENEIVVEILTEDTIAPVDESITEDVGETSTETATLDEGEPAVENPTEEAALEDSNTGIDSRENTASDSVDTPEENTFEVVEESSDPVLDSTSNSANRSLDSDDNNVNGSIVETEEGLTEATDSLDSQPNNTELEDVKIQEAERAIATEGQVEDTVESNTVEEIEPNANITETEAEESSLEPEEVTEELSQPEEQAVEEVVEEPSLEEEVVEEPSLEEEVVEEPSLEEEVVEEPSLEEEEEVVEEPSLEEEEEVVEEPSQEEEVAEKKNSESDLGQLDRVAYEAQVQEAPSDVAIQMQEEFQLTQLINSSGLQVYGTVPSVKDISRRLAQLAEQTGKRPAFINISLQQNQLESFVVLPDKTSIASTNSNAVASSDLQKINSQPQPLTLRKTIKNTSRKELMATATEFREEISDGRNLGENGYLESAQELYRVLIEPIEAELEANGIDILVFSMDSGLRLLPLAALHDGEQFLVEKYAMGIVPSFGLTDTRYVNLNQSPILAMGASEFEEQQALPTVAIELETIVRTPRQGETFLNEEFTIANFVAQNSREIPFPIVHLGTHAEFNAGDMSDSYIQFYDDKLKIPQLQQLSDQLGWNTDATPVELLVLSACETALGNEDAELGFAGLAVQAGVKSALASLWYVSDLGTLALMGEFYDRLGTNLVKAEALRQTQLAMLQGNVDVDNGQIKLSNGDSLPLPEEFPDGNLSLSHPYFWSAFTLIGNWN